MQTNERELWTLERASGVVRCVLIDWCGRVELQVRRATAAGDESIVAREMHATRATAYERARDLRVEHEQTQRP